MTGRVFHRKKPEIGIVLCLVESGVDSLQLGHGRLTPKLSTVPRNMAETIIGHIKEFSSLNLSRHRSVINAFVHIIAAITAYQINPFKPKRNLQPSSQLETTA
jgi:hypothetical protein